MIITYLFRSSGTGHSIETLFGVIQQEVGKSLPASHVRLPHISRGIRSVWKNLRFVIRQRFNSIVHITGDVHYTVLALSPSRTILTIHDCITLEKHRNAPLHYAFFWCFWFYLPVRRAAAVTVVSEKSRRELIHYLGRIAEKAIVVPNAYQPAFTYNPRSFNKEQPTLLQIGTASHKNLLRLMAALDGISCKLIIVGPLPESVTDELIARQIAYENHMNINQAEILQMYIRCDIVLFVSTYEGFGMPILEANAVGRAIVTSDRSPMRDVAAHAALLVDPTDVAAIKKGIQRVIDDDVYRQALIEEGLRNAANYTADVVAARYLSIYQKIGCKPT
jgi:glycosyltransferase involved in cell wall biosynthesis